MFFKKRKKENYASFCRTYYLMNILFIPDPDVPASLSASQDMMLSVATKHLNAVVFPILESSSAFAGRDTQLKAEMMAVRLVLFSLAFYHQTNFGLSVAQFGYTHSLLVDFGIEPFWDVMTHYVTGVAKMTDQVFVKDDEKKRVEIDKFRFESFKKWTADRDNKHLKESVARTLNFYGCPRDWSKTPRAIAYVAARLPERMGISIDDLGDKGGIAICVAIQHLYDSLVRDLDQYNFTLD